MSSGPAPGGGEGEYERFVGRVQHRLELAHLGEAVRACRAVLTTLGERLDRASARGIAEHLPPEIDRFLVEVEPGQSFSYSEFVSRVSERGGSDPPDANYEAQLLLAVVAERVPAAALAAARDALPNDFETLFEVADREHESG